MTPRAPFLLSVCLLAGAAAAPAAASEPNVPPSPEWQQTWARFLEANGPGWTFEWNGVTGTPHRISGHAIELREAVTRDNAEALAKRVVGIYAAVLRADPDDLVLARADHDRPARGNGEGTWYLHLRQVHHGVPVEGGRVRLIVRGRRLTTMGSDFYRGVDVDTTPSLSLGEAVAIVHADLGQTQLREPLRSTLVVAPRTVGGRLRYRLAWKVVTGILKAPPHVALPPSSPVGGPPTPAGALLPVQWEYLVDARSGRVLQRTNLLRYENVTGTVTGLVHQVGPADTPVTLPLAHLRVAATQGPNGFAANTGAAGHYTLSGLAAGSATLTSHLTGPHVAVHNGETPDPDTTYTAGVSAPGTHSWSFEAFDPSPGDVETNAFFHVNAVRDWFMRGDPFNVSLPYPLDVSVRQGAYCNASGGTTGLFFGHGIANVCEDQALCADIVYHEYGHAMIGKVYEDASVSLPNDGEGGAMNEAWADYFSSALLLDPSFGEQCDTPRNIDVPDQRFPDNWVGEVHMDGLIFSGALWDIRGLGTDYADGLALRALKQTSTSYTEYLLSVLEEDDDPAYSPSPLANADLSDGTPNIDVICHSYVDVHGIFHPACAGHTESLVAVITAPSPVAFNLFTAPAAIPITGSALGALSKPFQSFTLEYALQTAPSTWLTAGISLSGGGSAPVTDDTLGTLDPASLADGLYVLRLTVTDTAAGSASAQTSFVIDHSVKAGWPQASGVSFTGAPAVADLDPTVPGLEIAMVGGSQLYVWHADGTPVPGWPQNSGYTPASAPAVADLDGDGALEVVVADETGSVKVFHQDGTPAAGWPQTCGAAGIGSAATAALGDLDGDGTLEIVLGGVSGSLCAWHHDGSAAAGWPVVIGSAIKASVALGDLDNDGLPEIVVGAESGAVHAFHGNGTPVSGWPKQAGGPVRASGALGDLDGDGLPEFAVGSVDNKVNVWHADGTPAAGWPQAGSLMVESSSAAMADVDGDGDLEIVVMGNDSFVRVWQADGTALPGWPPSVGGYAYQPAVHSPAVGSIDGSGVELAWNTTTYVNNVGYLHQAHAYHADGTPLAGWPKTVGVSSGFTGSALALADLDQDGHVEALLGGDGVTVWDLPGSASADAMEWPVFRHDMRRTGFYGVKASVVLLFDTSGSMSWRHDGTMNVPVAEQRITKAKEAAYPFMELLNDFGAGKARFGIATFPDHPASGCGGEAVTPLTLVTAATTAAAVSTTIPGLTTENSTPLLAGIGLARSLFGTEPRKAIVLLSDGYHNCPGSVTVGSPEVTSLIGQLNADGVRVFAIGFGKPTDVDHPLLEAFSGQTTPPGFPGSQFYDVTTPAFDPLNWDPATALQSTYKDILVDALGLQSAVDPLGTLTAGSVVTQPVGVNEHDHRVSFLLSWTTARPGRLALTLLSSDGAVVPAPAPGVRRHAGRTYALVSVGPEFLSLPGKVGPAPWRLQVSGPGLDGDSEKYQYGVLLDSDLTFHAHARSAADLAGDVLRLTATVKEGGRRLTGLTDLRVRVSRPAEGFGDWLTANTVTPEQIARIPARRGTEPLPPVQRRALAITDVLGVPAPGQIAERFVRLTDDGTNGDEQAGDGIYTALWDRTPQAGSYTFHFMASGRTRGGNPFTREAVVRRQIGLRLSTAASAIVLSDVAANHATVTVRPRDGLGNFLGPGRSNAFRIVPDQGRMMGPRVDNADGSYRQVLVAPPDVRPEDVELRLVTLRP